MTEHEVKQQEAGAAAGAPTAKNEEAIWKEGLIQEALGSRSELAQLDDVRDFAASRKRGLKRGFEDAARKLTVDQLREVEELADRQLATVARHEMPGDLRGYLDDLAEGWDVAGFLSGYIEGVAEFVREVKRRLQQERE